VDRSSPSPVSRLAPPPRPPLFPYTTLFRSGPSVVGTVASGSVAAATRSPVTDFLRPNMVESSPRATRPGMAVLLDATQRPGHRSGQPVVPARRAVPPVAAVGVVEFGHLHHVPELDALDEELGDPVAPVDPDGLRGVEIDQVDLDLAAVAGVHGAGRVDDRQPGAGGEPGPRVDQS